MIVEQQQKIGFLDLIWHYKYRFASYIFAISFLTFTGLYIVGGVPEELRILNTRSLAAQELQSALNNSTSVSNRNTQFNALFKPNQFAGVGTNNHIQQPQFPNRIIIDKINVDALISNPVSASNDTLNNFLLQGTVRYPGSGLPGHGNMFIFGHSTGIRLVNNEAYKALNHLKDLNPGDEIKVQTIDREYVYKVTEVHLVDSDKQWVDLKSSQNMITLSTCNVFGEKQERFVVEGLFVSDHAL